MRSAMHENSAEKGKHLATVQVVRRAVSIAQAEPHTAQDVPIRLSRLFLGQPEASEQLSPASLAGKLWECMSHSFPEASSVGSGRRGPSENDRHQARAQS